MLLDAPAFARAASTSALEKALARAELHAAPADEDAVLIALAGLPEGTAAAPIERLGLGLDASGVWCKAAFVHLMPTLDSLQLHLIDHDLAPEEALALRAELAAHFAGDAVLRPALEHGHLGWRPGTVASLDPPASLALHEVREQMSPARADREVTRVLNEAQMFLHQHPINAAREARGQLTANALWCWGFGGLPPHPPRGAFQRARSASGRAPLLRGLAVEAGTPHRVALSASEPGIAAVAPGDRLDALLDEAMGSLGRGAVDAVWVHAAPFGAWRITPAARWRFWRRARPLPELFTLDGSAPEARR